MNVYRIVESPLGPITLGGDGDSLTSLRLGAPRAAATHADPQAFGEVCMQVEEYFAGARTAFDVRLGLCGSAFQDRVWDAMRRIPYGATLSYAALAAAIGAPKAARAVGHACARNPIAIVIPCHRVVGSSGALTGYAYGVRVKRRLLALEAARVRGRAVDASRTRRSAREFRGRF